GYQVENTRGRKLLDGEREITLPNGEVIEIKCNVKFADFSAHTDQPGIINFIYSLEKKQKIFCVHGEENKTIQLAERLSKIEGIEAYSPTVGETIKV
ncbi:MAG: MBL fold metallo-hydrolase RNA specificity domain-containing protein, partial [Candidatus Odinarchaeia archaeon]